MQDKGSEGIRTYSTISPKQAGLGPDSGGQSGDTQGLNDVAGADSESLVELLQEGQSFEAEAISGVEDSASSTFIMGGRLTG